VRNQTPYLIETKWESRIKGASYDTRGEDMVSTHIGFVRRVKVVPIVRGSKKTGILLYYGKVDEMS
jgi:hypothetical protein